jgi:hypothetical protein
VAGTPARRHAAQPAAQRIALVDLLDRVLAGGVVITGEITLSVADVDLVTISLRALLAATGALQPACPIGSPVHRACPGGHGGSPPQEVSAPPPQPAAGGPAEPADRLVPAPGRQQGTGQREASG